MDESFRETLAVDIHQELPRLSGDIIQQLLDRILQSGVESGEDLIHLELTDLQPPLNLIQARKLIKLWHQKYAAGADVSRGHCAESGDEAAKSSQRAQTDLDHTKEWVEFTDFDQASVSTSRNGDTMPHTVPNETPMSPGVSSVSTASSVAGVGQQSTDCSADVHPSDKLVSADVHPSDRLVSADVHPSDRLVSADVHPSDRLVSADVHPSDRLVSADASSLSTASSMPGEGTNRTDLTGSADMGTPESPTIADVPGSETEDTDKAGDLKDDAQTKPGNAESQGRKKSGNAGVGQSKPTPPKKPKKKQGKGCSKTYFKYVREVKPSVSVVFKVMVPAACNDVSLCLHQPYSTPPYVKIRMERKWENREKVFSCRAKIAWQKVGYHYIAKKKKVPTATLR